MEAHRPHPTEYYFFYGTLKDPSLLARDLQLPEPPKMRRARVTGYHLNRWWRYPVLIEGPPLHSVDGVAYGIRSEEQRYRLITYETDKYRLDPCLIEFLDNANGVEEIAEGATFMWNGKDHELLEGHPNEPSY
ncbi:hypothetical protein BDW62DRAFT_205552 [Aspergillus aurantiobrunneus]